MLRGGAGAGDGGRGADDIAALAQSASSLGAQLTGSISALYARVSSAALVAAISWNSWPRCWTLSGWYLAISRRKARLMSSAGASGRDVEQLCRTVLATTEDLLS